MTENKHKAFMAEAIRLAGENIKNGNGGPFGALVVKDGKIVSAAANKVTSTNDPTAHAEVVAIREACATLNTFDLSGCELYASCEPCPMCLGALMWARIEKLYYAANRVDAAKAGFDDELFYKELSLPPQQRQLPSQQLMKDEAIDIFNKWNEKPDKIKY